MGISGAHTFARFFRHSVHAVGVTTPWPLLRFDSCCAAPGGPDAPEPGALPDAEAAAGVPDDVDDPGWPGADSGPEADEEGRDNSPAGPPEPESESLGSSMVAAREREPY